MATTRRMSSQTMANLRWRLDASDTQRSISAMNSRARPTRFGLIPHTCFDELCNGGTIKSDRQAHLLILARAAAFTSLQGITSSGLARWSARRWSSSVFCDSVNDGVAPRLTMPSQMASTSSICSSMLSSLACCKSCVFMIWTPFKTNAAILARFVPYIEHMPNAPISNAEMRSTKASAYWLVIRRTRHSRVSISGTTRIQTAPGRRRVNMPIASLHLFLVPR